MTAPAPPTGVVVRAGDAEVLPFPDGSSMRLLLERVGDDATTTVHRSVLRDGAQGAGPHHHEATTELLYVLAGSVVLLVDDRVLSVGPGDLVLIPPGVTHAFAAEAGRDAEIFDVTTGGAPRFDLFRHMSRRANGLDTGAPERDGPDIYDTHPDTHPTGYPPLTERGHHEG